MKIVKRATTFKKICLEINCLFINEFNTFTLNPALNLFQNRDQQCVYGLINEGPSSMLTIQSA